MLKLFDETAHVTNHLIVKDSLTLHDASCAVNHYKVADYGLQSMYDEMQVRRRAAYKKIKDLGYDMIFDTGEYITKFPFVVPDDDDKVEFSIYETDNGLQVRIYLK